MADDARTEARRRIAAWHGLLNVSTGVRSRRLVLHGSSEPVTKESPDAT